MDFFKNLFSKPIVGEITTSSPKPERKEVKIVEKDKSEYFQKQIDELTKKKEELKRRLEESEHTPVEPHLRSDLEFRLKRAERDIKFRQDVLSDLENEMQKIEGLAALVAEFINRRIESVARDQTGIETGLAEDIEEPADERGIRSRLLHRQHQEGRAKGLANAVKYFQGVLVDLESKMLELRFSNSQDRDLIGILIDTAKEMVPEIEHPDPKQKIDEKRLECRRKALKDLQEFIRRYNYR